MKSKYQQAEDYLKSGKSLTPLQALNKFSIFRLAVVVRRMRQKRINIITEIVHKKDGTQYGKYILSK